MSLAILRSILEKYFIIVFILFVCGDPLSTVFINGLLFLVLFSFAHALGYFIVVGKEDNNDQKDQNNEEEISCFCFYESLFDLEQVQYSEVYATFVGCSMFSVGAVLDWREPWTEFPYLALYGGLGCCLVTHVVLRWIVPVIDSRNVEEEIRKEK